jgi:hypothetical protein
MNFDDLTERATRAARETDPLVWIEHIPTGYHLHRTREHAEFMLTNYPDQYRPATGPDNKDDGAWEQFDEAGNLIAASYPLPPRNQDASQQDETTQK